jgi:hypothetical protein
MKRIRVSNPGIRISIKVVIDKLDINMMKKINPGD